jgi:tetratricopeptide (TPR) repeat protein
MKTFVKAVLFSLVFVFAVMFGCYAEEGSGENSGVQGRGYSYSDYHWKNVKDTLKSIEEERANISNNSWPEYAYFNIGTYSEWLGNNEEAQEAYQKALDLNYPYEHIVKGRLLSLQGLYSEALEEYKKQLKISPNDGFVLTQIANVTDAFDAKVEYLKKSMDVDPAYIQAYERLTDLYETSCLLKESYILHSKMAEKAAEDNYKYCFNNMGFISYKLGRNNDAVKYFNKIIEMDSGDAFPYYNLGVVYEEYGDTANAKLNFEKAYSADPDFAHLHLVKGEMLKLEGKLEEAAAELQLEIEKNSSSAAAFFNLGDIYYRKGDLNGAAEQLDKAIDCDHCYTFAKIKRAEIDIAQGNFDSAISRLKEVREEAPDIEETYVLLPDALKKKAETEENAVDKKSLEKEADENIAVAQKISTDYQHKAEVQGDYFMSRHDYGKAVKAYEEELKKFPDRAVVINKKARALGAEGRKKAAAEAAIAAAVIAPQDLGIAADSRKLGEQYKNSGKAGWAVPAGLLAVILLVLLFVSRKKKEKRLHAQGLRKLTARINAHAGRNNGRKKLHKISTTGSKHN